MKDVFKDWIEPLREGFQKVIDQPSKNGRENVDDKNGRFFEDYCNWERIEEFKNCIFNSLAAQLVAEATLSKSIQIFLIKGSVNSGSLAVYMIIFFIILVLLLLRIVTMKI